MILHTTKERRRDHKLRRDWPLLSDEEREVALNKETTVGDDEGNTIIPLTPKALAILVITLLTLAGGGGTVISGIFHQGQATSMGQDTQAVQLAVLQTKVSNIEVQMAEFKEGQKEQTELIRRLLMHESEDHQKNR